MTVYDLLGQTLKEIMVDDHAIDPDQGQRIEMTLWFGNDMGLILNSEPILTKYVPPD